MMVKASGRSALIATGFFVFFAGPAPITATTPALAAATSTSDSAMPAKQVRQSARHGKRHARRSGKNDAKAAETKKPADKDVTETATDGALKIPPFVANANAQLAPVTPDSAQAMTAKANVLLASADKPDQAQSDSVVASDQLNDVDRALQETPGTRAVTMAAVNPAAAAPVLASSGESKSWDQTSLIGKIFIAFGALLTMASAARMFMA
jgi:hypothetical protein